MTPRPTYSRRPYQRGPNYAAWIVSALVATLVVIAIVVVLERTPDDTAPEPTREDPAVVQKRLEAEAAQAKEQQRQHSIRVLRQKLKRLDRRIASIEELLEDKYSWTRDKDLAEAKSLAEERAQVVAELKALGEEP